MRNEFLKHGILTIGIAASSFGAAEVSEERGVREVSFTFEEPVLGIELCDFGGDGWRDLVVAWDDGLQIIPLTAEGPTGKDWTIPRGDSRTLVFCVGEMAQGPESLFVLRDGGRVFRHDGPEVPEQPVVEDAAVTLPLGVYPVAFAQEFQVPGRLDLVLPRRDGLKLYLGNEDGFRPGPQVRYRSGTFLSVPDLEDLPAEVEQTFQVPAFEWSDQNGDGHADLSFAGSDLVQCFWTDAEGSLPEQATFEIDLEQLRKALGVDMEKLDPSNMFAALEGVVSQQLQDLDGDSRTDLLLREGGKVAVYEGGLQGVDRETARQVLKISGNLLAAFAADENADGRPDLCLLRIAKVSLAELLLWVVIGGSLDFELFAYHQVERLRFSDRPSSRRELTLSLPPLRKMEDVMKEPADRMQVRMRTIPVPLDWDGDGERDDAAFLDQDGDLTVYRDLCESEIPLDSEQAWLGTLNRYDSRVDGGDALTIDFEEFMDWTPIYGSPLFDAAADLAPDVRLPSVPQPEADHFLFRVDLDRDRRDDLALVVQESETTVLQLLSRLGE